VWVLLVGLGAQPCVSMKMITFLSLNCERGAVRTSSSVPDPLLNAFAARGVRSHIWADQHKRMAARSDEQRLAMHEGPGEAVPSDKTEGADEAVEVEVSRVQLHVVEGGRIERTTAYAETDEAREVDVAQAQKECIQDIDRSLGNSMPNAG
jgi:hypothetical protein